MLWKLAWKNIWRNKLRSGVILSAIVVGLIAAVFVVAFANGMISTKIDDAIDIEMTHLSLNSQEFIDYGETENYFTDNGLSERISALENVIGVSPRVIVNASVATAHDMGGIQMIGVNPDAERDVSILYRYIPDSAGVYLNEDLRMPAVVGGKFAQKYQVRTGSKIIVTVTDTLGEQQSAAFRVYGIFHTSNPSFEESKVFVLNRDLRNLTLLPDTLVHEIGIKVSSNDDEVVFAAKENVDKILPQGIADRTWKEINSIIAIYTDFFGIILYAIVGIILFALGFGIVNTILMSVVERQREFTMLIAIGMRRSKVMKLVIMEGILITVLGGFAGMTLGGVLVLLNSNGIDMSSSMGNYEFIGINTLVVPTISVEQFLVISLMVIVTGVISAIYPAKTATKWRKL